MASPVYLCLSCLLVMNLYGSVTLVSLQLLQQHVMHARLLKDVVFSFLKRGANVCYMFALPWTVASLVLWRADMLITGVSMHSQPCFIHGPNFFRAEQPWHGVHLTAGLHSLKVRPRHGCAPQWAATIVATSPCTRSTPACTTMLACCSLLHYRLTKNSPCACSMSACTSCIADRQTTHPWPKLN